MKKPLAVITGDIINSRKKNTPTWQPILTNILNRYGKQPRDWELYRGDSFQLTLPAAKALLAAIHLKAGIRQVGSLDVRMAIGLGERAFKAKKVTASTGTAFIRSGECFDKLKKQTLAIATGNELADDALNTMLGLALLCMDSWSSTVATVIVKALENPNKNQQEIARMIKKSQSSVSEALSRGGLDEVMKMEQYYQKQLLLL